MIPVRHSFLPSLLPSSSECESFIPCLLFSTWECDSFEKLILRYVSRITIERRMDYTVNSSMSRCTPSINPFPLLVRNRSSFQLVTRSKYEFLRSRSNYEFLRSGSKYDSLHSRSKYDFLRSRSKYTNDNDSEGESNRFIG